MKFTKLSLAILAIIAVGLTFAFATGSISYNPASILGSNPQQVGSLTLTNATPAIYTNTITFPFSFSQVPVFTVQNLSTNAANQPMTNSVTTTNLTIISAATNTTFIWTANIGYSRTATGVAISLAATPTNITLPFVFSSPPIIVASPSVTNSVLDVESVTISNFTLRCSSLSTNFWEAVGTAAFPGVNLQTQ